MFAHLPIRYVALSAVALFCGVWAGASLADANTLPAPNQYNSTPASAIATAASWDPTPYEAGGAAWTAPQDPNNPFSQSEWGQCTYWALEKRPDLASSAIGEVDAWDFAPHAAYNGYIVNNEPQVGDIAVWPQGYVTAGSSSGHVAYVEQVEADGSIVVSEMNGWAGGSNLDTLYVPEVDVDGTNTYTGDLPASDWNAQTSTGELPNDNQLYFIHLNQSPTTTTTTTGTTGTTTPTSSPTTPSTPTAPQTITTDGTLTTVTSPSGPGQTASLRIRGKQTKAYGKDLTFTLTDMVGIRSVTAEATAKARFPGFKDRRDVTVKLRKLAGSDANKTVLSFTAPLAYKDAKVDWTVTFKLEVQAGYMSDLKPNVRHVTVR